ncbi:MAG: DUF4416 family protein [Acidobacteriota bacterium]
MIIPATRLHPAPPAKFFLAVAATGPVLEDLQPILEPTFGPLEPPSPVYCFSHFSTYYDAEAGGPVWKYLVGLRELLASDQIVSVKLEAERLQWERATSDQGGLRRRFNLDPGYVNGWQVVLSTVKNHGHRLYLGQGVFAEVTLLYREGAFRSFPWTYPDYQTPLVLDYLGRMRQAYLKQVRGA